MTGERQSRTAGRWRVALLAALTTVMVAFYVLAGGAAEAQTVPTTNFVYLQLTRGSPGTVDHSYVGTFSVQYDYTLNSLSWGFLIASQWVQQAKASPVKFTWLVTIRGKEVNIRRPYVVPANYQFHSSMRENFQFVGDAFWTEHPLRRGDTVDVTALFSYLIPEVSAAGLNQAPAEHDFWAHYQVSIR